MEDEGLVSDSGPGVFYSLPRNQQPNKRQTPPSQPGKMLVSVGQREGTMDKRHLLMVKEVQGGVWDWQLGVPADVDYSKGRG